MKQTNLKYKTIEELKIELSKENYKCVKIHVNLFSDTFFLFYNEENKKYLIVHEYDDVFRSEKLYIFITKEKLINLIRSKKDIDNSTEIFKYIEVIERNRDLNKELNNNSKKRNKFKV